MNETLHPAFCELTGITELPDEPVYAHTLAESIRDKKRAVLENFHQNSVSRLVDGNYQAGKLFLGSFGLVTMVSGIQEGYAHIATQQIQDLRRDALHYNVHPLIKNEPTWRAKESAIVQILYEQGVRNSDYGNRTKEGIELDHSDMARYFSALIELSVESFNRTETQNNVRLAGGEFERALVRESALALLTSTELAVQQIWSGSEVLQESLRRLLATYDRYQTGKDSFASSVSHYAQKRVLKLK